MDTGGFKKQMHKHTDWKWTSLALAAVITALGIYPAGPLNPAGIPEALTAEASQEVSISPIPADTAAPKASISPNQVPVTHAPAASEYDNKVVANVTDVLNLRAEPSLEGKIIGKCYRGAGGTILEKKDGWTKIRSGKLEGWLNNDYLVFGQDIRPLAKELGLFTARVTTQTLNVREEPTTESAIIGLAAGDDYYPVLEEKDGWAKIQLASDTSGYVSTDYTKISVSPGKAISIEAELAALKETEKQQTKKKAEEAPKYVINVSSDEIYLLASCVMMEAGGYSYDGQLAVASTIVNRVKSGRWGSSVTDVIYAQGQFPGATSGLLDKYLTKGPSSSALKATKAALSGTNNIGDYLFFNSTKNADYESYASYTVVDGNCFYKK
ncbi:SH3 domain protein [Clostridiales bacterium 1_7_47FAA]|nr:SH3 domain protein [Clostridiales bacterium 1_7_47FAA]